jgi:hypothetical protein
MNDNMDASFIGCNLKDTLARKNLTFAKRMGQNMWSHPSEFPATHMYALKYQSANHEETLIPAGI